MKRSKLLLTGTIILASFTALAHKQCDLALTLVTSAGSSTTLNFGETCYFDFKITNNGSEAIGPTDTLYFGMPGSTGVSRIIPPGPVPSGGSFTATRRAYATHDVDTVRTADMHLRTCHFIFDQALIAVGNPPQPVAVTYEDAVRTNDTGCMAIVFKKRPTNGVIEFGGGAREALSLYPNPATSEVGFDIRPDKAEKVTVSVLDISGRTVLTHDFGKLPVGVKTSLRLDVRQLKEGFYFVSWSSGERRGIGKLSIKR